MLKAPWDVWIADVKFEDNPLKSKRRPVIILESDSVITLSIKGTTHMPRSGYPGEYTLIDWKEAGLDRETVVRCSQPIYLEESDFKKPIGKLRIIDIINFNYRHHKGGGLLTESSRLVSYPGFRSIMGG